MVKKKQKFSLGKRIIILIVVLSCIAGVFWAAAGLLGMTKSINFKELGIKTITRTVGQEPIKDKYENINIMLVGVGGTGHSGGYLADSIIVASFDTEDKSVSMLSLPRDLYVKKDNYGGKINSLFSRGYSRGQKNIGSGAVYLKSKVEEIVGVSIPYYAVIDFKGFEKFIDAIGKININVPETIYDKQYPISEENGGKYGVFYIQAGPQTLDGATALKYARSRHSTDDFSRSIRQQQIISAIKDKVFSSSISIGKIRDYYSLYNGMVTTNLSLQEMLGMYKYLGNNGVNIHTFGLNVNCSYKNFERTEAGCFLYYPKREEFGGASVILPMGATARRTSFYEYVNNFAKIIFHEQKYLSENVTIVIKNAIEKEFARKNRLTSSGWAMKVAVKLKKYGFKVKEIENYEDTLDTTTIVVPGTGNVAYSGTIKTLQRFIPTTDIVNSVITGSTNLEIILGNDFITQVVNSGFDYNILLSKQGNMVNSKNKQ